MNTQQITNFCNQLWDDSIVAELAEYIKNPCKSPEFDRNWKTHGYLAQAVEQFSTWAMQHAPKNMTLDVIKLEGRTPLLFIDIPGECDDTVLLYGHLDKQPEMKGWDDDLAPWKPVLKDNKLYGRGGADDGYALFASLTAINALQDQNIPHARCVIIIEASEESGSVDLPYYIDHLHDRIGEPSLVICLDSGAGNYEQLWSTTSLRGVINADLKIEILKEGLHSGLASGVVPDSFRILRQLLSRIEDENTGEIRLPECHVEIPTQRKQQAKVAAKVLDASIYQSFPFVADAKPTTNAKDELLLFKSWHPTLVVTGIDGIPSLDKAGNTLRPYTHAKLSFRLPPTCDVNNAAAAISHALTHNPPYSAKISLNMDQAAAGWNAPEVADWLHDATDKASYEFFGKQTVYMGEGGSIPFMGMLGEKFPQAQFLITGVLGPKSNAHGPNEFLHIPTAKKLTMCTAYVLAQHYLTRS